MSLSRNLLTPIGGASKLGCQCRATFEANAPVDRVREREIDMKTNPDEHSGPTDCSSDGQDAVSQPRMYDFGDLGIVSEDEFLELRQRPRFYGGELFTQSRLDAIRHRDSRDLRMRVNS